MNNEANFIRSVRSTLICAWAVTLIGIGVVLCVSNPAFVASLNAGPTKKNLPEKIGWSPPNPALISTSSERELILYGRRLVAHTSVYLGPKGKVKSVTNGMNCQNCHLNAGTLIYGNNYSAVASTYPKYRDRSGTIESIEKRVNDCIERSLNGKKLDEASREMRALVSYIKWVGKDVRKDSIPRGAGLWRLSFLERAADPAKGKVVYQNHCVRCHGQEGEGIMNENGMEWKYPPLGQENSFTSGAGLFRLSRFAGYVKTNMPNDLATYKRPVLTDEEAWDVAAFVVSLPRPKKNISSDWPDISRKPFDHPFGPYTDGHSEEQHKFGPFAGILAAQKKNK
jgi:thiosulfate dehydrogenase